MNSVAKRKHFNKNNKTRSKVSKNKRKGGSKKSKRKTRTKKSNRRTRKNKNIKTNINLSDIKENPEKFIKLNCSPENKDKKYTCFSDEDLHKLREMWNARHPDAKIVTNDSKEIWTSLKQFYGRTCNKESCWVKQIAKGTKMEDELMDSFSPEMPPEWKKNPTEWLSSLDINDVMKQYEQEYKCFDFIGPSPIDYDTQKLYGECVWEELCHFSLADQIKKDKTKIGIIFNTDPHYKGGSHWISLFINIKKGRIFFFDSAGDKIPDQVMKFVNMVTEQGHRLQTRVDFHFDQNHPNDHQQNTYSCGVYSLFFLVHMLEDKVTENYLKTHQFKDEYIESFRKIYFNSEL